MSQALSNGLVQRFVRWRTMNCSDLDPSALKIYSFVMGETDTYRQKAGQFLGHFAEIEHQTYFFLRLLGTDDLVKYAETIKNFKPRVKFLQALLKSSGWDDWEDVSRQLDRAIELAKFRNELMHNPVTITVSQDFYTGKIEEKAVIQDARSLKKLDTLERIDAQIEIAQEIASTFVKRNLEWEIVER